MNVRGVGIDIVEIGRFRKKPYKTNKGFYERVFTPAEIAYCLKKGNPAESFAVRFAAKEAAMKSLGVFSKDLKNIEILQAKTGAPEIKIKGEKKKKFFVSLSHANTHAAAIVLCVI